MNKLTIIYPRWPKLPKQTEFHLPPHGPVCLAAEVPQNFQVTFVDDNVETFNPDERTDVVLLSMMLTCQTPRGREIARIFRSRGIKVIAGGIATMLHSEEVSVFVDSVFLGEVENGRLALVLDDWGKDQLQATYDFFHNFPPIDSVGPANRNILKDELYTYRGVRMVDLVHASRGCKFNCFPCSTAFLGGRQFRPRPIDKVIEEVANIDNNRLFFVDNSLAQDKQWLLELFDALIPLKKKWVSHPILEDDEVLAKAAEAGAWYVYQAIYDTSEIIRERVRRLKEFGIGVEAAVLLGTDNQDVDFIKRLIDFLLEIDVDMAEFSILTPFPHAPVTRQFEKEGRILHKDWGRYNTAEVVYQPRNMTPDELETMYQYAWDTFYKDIPQNLRMSRLFMRALQAEMHDNS